MQSLYNGIFSVHLVNRAAIFNAPCNRRLQMVSFLRLLYPKWYIRKQPLLYHLQRYIHHLPLLFPHLKRYIRHLEVSLVMTELRWSTSLTLTFPPDQERTRNLRGNSYTSCRLCLPKELKSEDGEQRTLFKSYLVS